MKAVLYNIADARSPASAESRARQRSQSTTFTSNAHWQAISCGSQQKMSCKGFNPSSSFPKIAVKTQAMGETVSASRLLITACLQTWKPELKTLGNRNLNISGPDSVLFFVPGAVAYICTETCHGDLAGLFSPAAQVRMAAGEPSRGTEPSVPLPR